MIKQTLQRVRHGIKIPRDAVFSFSFLIAKWHNTLSIRIRVITH